MRVLVSLAAADQILLAERAPLACAGTLVSAILDGRSLSAVVRAWRFDDGGIAEEHRTLGVVSSGIFQAKREAGVIATLVVLPLFGCEFRIFGYLSDLDDWGNNIGQDWKWCWSWSRSWSWNRWVLCHSDGQEESSNRDKLHSGPEIVNF